MQTPREPSVLCAQRTAACTAGTATASTWCAGGSAGVTTTGGARGAAGELGSDIVRDSPSLGAWGERIGSGSTVGGAGGARKGRLTKGDGRGRVAHEHSYQVREGERLGAGARTGASTNKPPQSSRPLPHQLSVHQPSVPPLHHPHTIPTTQLHPNPLHLSKNHEIFGHSIKENNIYKNQSPHIPKSKLSLFT